MMWLFDPAPSGQSYAALFLVGIANTVILSLSSTLVACAIGLVVGILNSAGSQFANIYLQIFRNTPLLVQLFAAFYLLPNFIPMLAEIPYPVQVFGAGFLALTLYIGARLSAQVQAGIEATPDGQFQSAKALGLTAFQVYRLVVLPQALRAVSPAIANEWVSAIKNSSVVSTIGFFELTKFSADVVEYTSRTFTVFAMVAASYLLLNLTVLMTFRVIERKMRVGGVT